MAVKFEEEREFIAPCLLLNSGINEIICDLWNNAFGSLEELAGQTYSFYSHVLVVDKSNSNLANQEFFSRFPTWLPITGSYIPKILGKNLVHGTKRFGCERCSSARVL